MRPGLVFWVTFQDLIDNEVAREESSIPVKYVGENLLQAFTLLGHSTVQPHWQHCSLLNAVLHDLSNTWHDHQVRNILVNIITHTLVINTTNNSSYKCKALHPVLTIRVGLIQRFVNNFVHGFISFPTSFSQFRRLSHTSLAGTTCLPTASKRNPNSCSNFFGLLR